MEILRYMPIDWSATMRRTGISVVIIICLTFPLLPHLYAKMSVISPEEMIGKSEHIVVGIIKKRNYTEKHREVIISVDNVLKGDIHLKEIFLQQDIDAMGKWVTFDFPKEGNKVFVLLRNIRGGYSLTYANSVCVINKNNRFQLFEGMGFGKWSPRDYEDTYHTYYKNAIDMHSDTNEKP